MMDLRRVVTYERTSSEDQRERATIKTQTEELARRLSADREVQLVKRYIDDGVSGKIPMARRPDGARLMEDAGKGLFKEVWIYRVDRLGRDDVDPLIVWRDLERLGIKVHSVTEGISDLFMYHIHVAVAAQERRTFLARSADGMNRAAKEGRYCGGIVPLGYVAVGKRPDSRLTPSEKTMWMDWTEADLVRRIYHWLAVEHWSCRRIAMHLNDLGVPTAYQKDGRGVRNRTLQHIWRPGRIRNLVVNAVYRGELQYGRRSYRPGGREVISASVAPLVSEDIWYAAQETLKSNRVMAKNTKRTYLLKSVIKCGTCGLNYSASNHKGVLWYRCNGQLVERGPHKGRCPGKSVQGRQLEPVVWRDVERFLRDPADGLLEELAAERNGNGAAAVAEAERETLQSALRDNDAQRERLLDVFQRGIIDPDELEARLGQLKNSKEALEERLQAQELEEEPSQDALDQDLLAELRRRLDDGLDERQRQEIVSLLVKRILIRTEVMEGRKKATAVVEYRFTSVVNFSRGTDSWRR